MHLIDTHAHLNSEQLAPEIEGVLARAERAGVQQILCIGIDRVTSELAVAQANQFAPVFAVVGIQPNYCNGLQDSDFDRIAELATASRVVAIGETGLDLYWDDCPLDTQRYFFRKHIELALQLDKPFVVHMRDCQTETLELVYEYREHFPLRGVMHSFTGDTSGAEKFLAAGMHISFAGMVTYKKSESLRQVAAVVPADRLLIETDSPYLSPEPKRSQRPNEPALVQHTAACLARTRNVTIESIAEQTTRNAQQLFRI